MPQSRPSAGGCPIRRPSDHRVPAPPRRVSSRGHVLRRPSTPRHPPCALLSDRSPHEPGGNRPASWCARRSPINVGVSTRLLGPRLWRTPSFVNVHPHPWSRGDSNPGPPPCKSGALPAELRPPPAGVPPASVGAPGLEPGTSALSGPRSNHLSYAPGWMGLGRHRASRSRAEDEADLPLDHHAPSRGLPVRAGVPAGRPRAARAPPRNRCPAPNGSSAITLDLGSMRPSPVALPRKEVIQPQLPLRLPCYDFVPITSPTLGGCALAVRPPTSGVAGFHDVTGGVYKAREHIHRSTADPRLLATPPSRGRVAAHDPN